MRGTIHGRHMLAERRGRDEEDHSQFDADGPGKSNGNGPEDRDGSRKNKGQSMPPTSIGVDVPLDLPGMDEFIVLLPFKHTQSHHILIDMLAQGFADLLILFQIIESLL